MFWENLNHLLLIVFYPVIVLAFIGVYKLFVAGEIQFKSYSPLALLLFFFGGGIIWRLCLFPVMVSKRYHFALLFPGIMLALFGVAFLTSKASWMRKKEQNIVLAFIIFTIAIVGIAKGLHRSNRKEYLKDVYKSINRNCGGPENRNAVLLEYTGNHGRINYNCDIAAIRFNENNELKENIYIHRLKLEELIYSSDKIYFLGRNLSPATLADAFEGQFKQRLAFEQVDLIKTGKYDYFLFRIIRPESITGEKVTGSDTDAHSSLLHNGDFKKLEKVSISRNYRFMELKKRGFKFLKNVNSILFPVPWEPNSGQGWRSDSGLDSLMQPETEEKMRGIRLKGQKISLYNIDPINQEGEFDCCVEAIGEKNSLFLLQAYVYAPNKKVEISTIGKFLFKRSGKYRFSGKFVNQEGAEFRISLFLVRGDVSVERVLVGRSNNNL